MKKLFYSIPLVLAVLSSCGQQPSGGSSEVPEIVFGTIEDNSYFQDEVAYTYTDRLVYVVSDGFEELKDSLDAVNRTQIDYFKENSGSEALPENEEDVDDYILATLPWSEQYFYSVQSCSPSLLSVLYSFDSWMGGAHPNSETAAWNFDVKTGARLALRDVAGDYDAIYKKVVADLEELNGSEEYDGVFFDEWKDTVDALFTEEGSQPEWSLDENGLSIFFNTYSIAPYVAGPVSLDYPYADYPDFIKKEFIPSGSAKPVEIETSDIFKDVFENFSRKVDKMNYEACAKWFEGKGYDCEFEVPYENESNGSITVKDENGMRIILNFWPVGDEPSMLYFVECRNDDFNLQSGHQYQEEGVRDCIIDYNEHLQISFDSGEDAKKVFFNYYLKRGGRSE